MEFRSYAPHDASAIEHLFETVFTESEGESEGALVGGLARELMAGTDSKELHGFVAVDLEQIIGAIFFSRLTVEQNIDVFILAPVAVRSGHQGMGIGQALIRHGLKELKRRGVRIVTTYGDPKFYSKVGFRPLSQETIKAPFTLSQPEGWLGQSLTNEPVETIPGRCSCVKALNNPSYW
ncbi:MAG: GNAT family N-acetyltransferase [Desulfovibrionales bacterium]